MHLCRGLSQSACLNNQTPWPSSSSAVLSSSRQT
eukprot:CAMPEP_0179171888 /NCGR_PEP_ID=MMETSP0796-20121207/84750_1 /TAXON_ID=73915 /ORGANISM="Pyrodinium bahamense, Strain pbaha01" /LENGTH=33 /DNA_ID= /DNA_START= /DNA_END= /DNA_ORIENTATION=